MNISVQRMEPEQSREVAELVKLVIAPLPYYNLTARESEIRKYDSDNLAEMSREDPDSVSVARAGGIPVGFCLSKLDDGLIWLAWIGVHQDFRRKGVAVLLLKDLEATVPKRGCHKIWADCRTENEAMKCMFPKMGYATICCVTNHWYKQDFFLWEKVIVHDCSSSD